MDNEFTSFGHMTEDKPIKLKYKYLRYKYKV